MAALQEFFFSQMRSNLDGFQKDGKFTKYVDMAYYGSEHGLFSGVGRGWSTFRPDGNDIPYIGDKTTPSSANPFLNHCIFLNGVGDIPKGTVEGSTRAKLNSPCVVPDKTSYICSKTSTDFTTGDAVGSYTECTDLPGYEASAGSDTNTVCGDYTYCTTSSTSKISHTPRTYFCQNHQGKFCENDVKDASVLDVGDNAKYGITVTAKYPGTGGFCKSNSDNNGANSCLWKGASENPNKYDELRHCHRGNETVTGTYGTVDRPPFAVPFSGGYRTRVYDPRYRAWYKVTRNQMRATTSSVYTMFTSGQLGFTITLPVFDYCKYVRGAAAAGTNLGCKPYDEILAGEVLAPNVAVSSVSSGTITTGTAHGFVAGMRVKATSGTAASFHTVTSVTAATSFTVSPSAPAGTSTVNEARAKTLAGVMGIDYILVAFNQWLIDNYGKGAGLDAKYVFIEEAADNSLIASSLEVPLYVSKEEVDKKVKSSAKDRRKTTDAYLENDPSASPTDKYLPMYTSAQALKNESYASCTSGELLRISLPERGDDGQTKKRADGTAIEVPFYVQCLEYKRAGINWRVVIASRGEKSFDDFISFSQPETAGMGAIIVVIGTLGSLITLLFLVHLLINRHKDYYRIGDWRFLGLFELGALLCCLTVFTYIGPDSKDELGSQAHATLCVTRVWLFNIFFTFTFSALFWKVHRMWKLLDNPRLKKIVIKDSELALKLMVLVLVEVIILGIWTGVDPPKPMVNPGVDGVPSDFVDHVVCSSETATFAIIEIVWKVILSAGGCFLAFKSRNVGAKYAESKGLMAAMYNVAFIGIVILLLVFLLGGVGENGKTLLKAIGVFWGSVFSVAVIVIPRIMGASAKFSSTTGTAGTAQTSSVTPSTDFST